MTRQRAWSRRARLLLVLGTLGLGSALARTPAAAAPASKTVAIVIEGIAFTPATAEAHVGDTIVWTNKDVVDHTATEQHDAWHVEVKAGKTGSLVLKKAGTFDYYCEYHPNMKGQLTVKPAASFEPRPVAEPR